jgi:hypothetical protein
MPKTKTFIIIFATAWVAIIVIGVVGNGLQARGLISDPATMARVGLYAKIIIFTLFVVQSFCLLPLALRLFVALQIKIGNREHALVKALIEHERGVIYAYWAVWFVGLVVALPTIIREMF